MRVVGWFLKITGAATVLTRRADGSTYSSSNENRLFVRTPCAMQFARKISLAHPLGLVPVSQMKISLVRDHSRGSNAELVILFLYCCFRSFSFRCSAVGNH